MLDLLKPVLQQAAKKKRGRKAKPKPVYVSRKLELQYSKELLDISKLCQDEAASLVIPEVSKYVGDDWFAEAIHQMKLKLTAFVAGIAQCLASKTVNAQKQATDLQLSQQLKQSTGIDLVRIFNDEALNQVIQDAIAANVALIKSIPAQYVNQVETVVLSGLQSGKRAEVIKKDILAIGQSTNKRALLIARDQLGKINSRITQTRQESLGITHYTWSTSHDERVRHSHRARNGKLFAWDSPPDDGHPGIPIRCRCTAIPYTDHLMNPDAPTPAQLMAKPPNNS